ncbi:MAG TPA: sugar isomerase [archaeon]|nr:sugar isomerase [archaeon]
MNNNLNRRDFLKVTGLVAPAVIASSCRSGKVSPAKSMLTIGSPLRVKPALIYKLHERQEATSWRRWGGLQSRSDVEAEKRKIEQELKELSSKADFPMEILPVAQVTTVEQAAEARDSDCDMILTFWASGEYDCDNYETLAASEKPNVMFLRHKSGPIYGGYLHAQSHMLRKRTDEYRQPGMDVWDIVVDDYAEVLWRLRSLYGLKNALGTRIVAIGGPGSWGNVWNWGLPAPARDIWKLDIRTVTYEELEPVIKKAMGDRKTMEEARRQTDQYLAQKGVSLHTDKSFLVNAFVLKKVFRELMDEAEAPAITVKQCMTTIMPIAQTTACMPLSLINDEGLMAFCESDFVVIPAGILLRYISGKPVFLHDPCTPHDGVTTCAHCTAPRRMNGRDLEPAKILTHFESDYGAAPKVEFSKGQVVTNLAPSFSSKKWLGFRGKILDHPFHPICRSQIDVEIEGDWRKLLEDMQGFHWLTCYGDYLREVGYAVRKIGIAWQDITAGRGIMQPVSHFESPA